MNNKFNYPIFEDRVYTLNYDGYLYKVTGEEILAMFRRSAFLDKFIEELSTANQDLSTD